MPTRSPQEQTQHLAYIEDMKTLLESHIRQDRTASYFAIALNAEDFTKRDPKTVKEDRINFLLNDVTDTRRAFSRACEEASVKTNPRFSKNHPLRNDPQQSLAVILLPASKDVYIDKRLNALRSALRREGLSPQEIEGKIKDETRSLVRVQQIHYHGYVRIPSTGLADTRQITIRKNAQSVRISAPIGLKHFVDALTNFRPTAPRIEWTNLANCIERNHLELVTKLEDLADGDSTANSLLNVLRELVRDQRSVFQATDPETTRIQNLCRRFLERKEPKRRPLGTANLWIDNDGTRAVTEIEQNFSFFHKYLQDTAKEDRAWTEIEFLPRHVFRRLSLLAAPKVP